MATSTQWLKEHSAQIAIALGAGALIAGTAYYLSSKSAPPAQKKPSAPLANPAAAPAASPAASGASAASSDDEALAAKNAGNEAFKNKQYEVAIAHYTRAIELSKPGDKQLAIFYSNRAACHLALKNYSAVVSDCSEAVKIDKQYVKALLRRGQAYEALEQYREAIYDYTTICILNKFQDQGMMQTAERMLQQLGRKTALEKIGQRPLSLPGVHNIKMYLESFPAFDGEALTTAQLTDMISTDDGNGELYMRRALARLHAEDYENVLGDANKAVDLLQAKLDGEAECDRAAVQALLNKAYELQGSFLYLNADANKAVATFGKILASQPENVSVILRRALTFLEQGQTDTAIDALSVALRVAPNDPFCRYHNAQALMIKENFPKALQELQTCVSLHPTFPAPYIHLALVQLRTVGPEESLKTFTTTQALFPTSGDVLMYQAQVILQGGDLVGGTELLRKASELSPSSPFPTLFLAQLSAQTGDIDGALALLNRTLQIDAKFDAAYQLLAQLSLQRRDVPKAIEYFDKAIATARSLDELTQACAAREAAFAQQYVISSDPSLRAIVESLQRS